jgi:hypothetical protein
MNRLVAALIAGTLLAGGCGDGYRSDAPVTAPSLRAGEFAIPTLAPPLSATPTGCPAALTTGELALLEDGSLGLDDVDGTTRVRWPFGWRGSSGPPVVLLDAEGTVIATVGEVLEVGGGFINDWWLGCGGVRVVG